jgi:alpha-glucosidase
MADFGYDVSDYCDVHPDFGTLDTMDRLTAECHTRGIRLLLDWVPNHTSDQHPWFLESKSSRENPKRDWYIWRDPQPDGSLPNNWRAAFGGPTWTWHEGTQQHYLHSFLKEQPDLNWRNPEVVAAMHDTLRFWLVRGIDGFRIDVMGQIVKHPELADNPPNPAWTPKLAGKVPKFLMSHSRNYPDVFAAVKGIRRVLDEYRSVAVGEVSAAPTRLRSSTAAPTWTASTSRSTSSSSTGRLHSHSPLGGGCDSQHRPGLRGAVAARLAALLRARQPRPREVH